MKTRDLDPALKLAGFGAALLVLFGGGALAGGAFDPDRASREPAHATEEAGHGAEAAHAVRGVAVAEKGLRLVVANPELRRGREQLVRFRIVDEAGRTVRDFDVEHEKRMHVIVARRDLTGFQHLHPRQAADGSWAFRLRLREPGSYRLFADLSHAGERATPATDLRVDGPADLRPLPRAASVARTGGGYEVRLAPVSARPGREAQLRFTITRDGTAVRPEPYLGAAGHLVALREGDLAFLHVHPEGLAAPTFAATFPTAGGYRLFLQFKHAGRVRTVAFSREVR